MRPNIHPEYKQVKVVCSCGNTFTTGSTLGKEQLSLEVCAACHPFYTGTQKMVDTAGRVDRFRQKYSNKGRTAAAAKPKAEKVEKAEAPKKEAKKDAPKKEVKKEVKKAAPKKEAHKKEDKE